MKSRFIPFHYLGGKATHLDWLYSCFPDNVHLVDAMCGSATVAINAPYKLKTINDVNSDIINFFRVLRDDHQRLITLLQHTPFSREEFYAAAEPSPDPVENARRFYIRAMQGFGGTGTFTAENNWGYEMNPVTSSGRHRTHFRGDTWNNKIQELDWLISKLRTIQIENESVFDLIARYNRKGILLYLDPPYKKSVIFDKKRYKYDFEDQDHSFLASLVQDANAYVAISGYDSDHYNELYPEDTWYKTYNQVRKTNVKKRERQEVLWTNYDPSILRQSKLF